MDENKTIKLVDLTFVANTEFADPHDVLHAQQTSLAYIQYLDKDIFATVIKHWLKKISFVQKNVLYCFFPSGNHFFNIPFNTYFFLWKHKPDAVIVQGLGNPWQLIWLRLVLGKQIKIIVQHHGDQLWPNPKKIFQQWAGKLTDAWMFTSAGNAMPWIGHEMIRNTKQCYEVLEASAYMSALSKTESRKKLGIDSVDVFLWVGRFNNNKDPLTVLNGFAGFLTDHPAASLYMIYQTEELLPDVKALLDKNAALKKAVHLVGQIPHTALTDWYSAADFFISGSHSEGSGYALIEAMACGCIPVVTDIPSFRKITGDGRYGFLFTPGDADSLVKALAETGTINRAAFSGEVLTHFQKELSFQKIGQDISSLIKKIIHNR